MARNFTVETNRFLGLHQCRDGEGVLKKGESPRMKNLKVTPTYSLIQREGWEKLCQCDGEGRGIFVGRVKDKTEVVWVTGESVWRLADGAPELLGTLESTSGRVSIFRFFTSLYFLDGVKIKVWDTESFGDIQPYVPTIAVSCDNTGAGTPFEDVNLLTGQKKQLFTPDSYYVIYQLAETEIDSVDEVSIKGVMQLKSKYEVDLTAGTVKFKSQLSETGVNTLSITYTKKSTSQSELIHNMKYAVAYGTQNDTRVFLWGDDNYPSHLRYSGVHDGESHMDYFPELYFNKVGSGGKINSVLRHYDSLDVFTEDEAFSCTAQITEDSEGLERTTYPVRTLSTLTGCGVENFAKLIDNKPITLTASGLYVWSSPSIRDERNAQEIGERIAIGLSELDLKNVSSFDREDTGEFYIWCGDKMYVYNYALDVFYYYEGFDAVGFAQDSDRILFLRRDGSLCVISDTNLDDGQPIDFFWETSYGDILGLETKNISRLEFEVYPRSSMSFDVVWASDRVMGSNAVLSIAYSIADFADLHFESMSFATAQSPVILRKRIKGKRIHGLKVIVKNESRKGDFHLFGVRAFGKTNDAL